MFSPCLLFIAHFMIKMLKGVLFILPLEAKIRMTFPFTMDDYVVNFALTEWDPEFPSFK